MHLACHDACVDGNELLLEAVRGVFFENISCVNFKHLLFF
jgi:hypothetical protein